MPRELYNDDCILICSPDVGISGTEDNKCGDLFSKKTNDKLVWQDDRKLHKNSMTMNNETLTNRASIVAQQPA